MNSGTTKKLLWAVFLSFAFMALLLYGVDWSHFSHLAERIHMYKLLAAFGVLLIANIVRSWRFFTLDHLEKKKYGSWLIINKLYNYLTATLPGGIGEAATAYLIKRYSSFDMMSAFRILLLSRVLDLTGISALLFFAAVLVRGNGYYHDMLLWFAGILLLISITMIMPATERLILKLMQKLPGKNRLMQRAREKLNELSEISEEHRGNHTLRITLFQSAVITVGTALSVYFILTAYEADFTVMRTFYCFSVYAVLQMIPIQGIAGIGTQPARWVVALNLAGYTADDAVALSIVLHGTLYVCITIMGLAALGMWLVSRRTVQGRA